MSRLKNFGLCLTGILLLFVTFNAKSQEVSFSFLEEYARKNSPLMWIINSETEIVKSERKHQLMFNNPGIGFERESIDDEYESLFSVSQTLPMPWVYGRNRAYWKEYERAGLLHADWKRLEMLAHLKTDYVRLVYMKDELEFLRSVIPVLDSLKIKLVEQQSEGWISGLEVSLIQNSLLELDGHAVELEYEYSLYMTDWLSEMGLPSETDLQFLTPEKLLNLANCAIAIDPAVLESSPYLLAEETKVSASQKKVKVENGNWFQDVEIEGGIKKLSNNSDGIVVGVGIPLPLWNRNSQQARIALEQAKIASLEFEIQRRKFISEINSRINTCRNLQTAIGKGNIDAERTLGALVEAYHAGQINLAETLSALQGILQGQDQWRALNLSRFSNIFALEAMTGQKAFQFEEKTDE